MSDHRLVEGSGMHSYSVDLDQFRSADQIRQDERERCAAIADSEADNGCRWTCDCGEDHSRNIAAKIREGKV